MSKNIFQKDPIEISIFHAIIIMIIIAGVSVYVTSKFYESLIVFPQFDIAVSKLKPRATPTYLVTTPTPTPNPDINTWETYRNDKVGFSLNYPKEWGSVKTEQFNNAIYGPGEYFYIEFTNDSFTISGNTTDFTPYENPSSVYLQGDPLKYCKDQEKYVFASSGCKEINKNIVIVSRGSYLEVGMFGSGNEIYLLREAFIENQSNKYAALTITYRFPVYQNDKLVDMSEVQIKDIAKNELFKLDKKTIDIFDQIISTFKFTK